MRAQYSQLIHDMAAWIEAGQSPHRLPGDHRPAHTSGALDALLGADPPAVRYDRSVWRFVLTEAGEKFLVRWNDEHAVSPEVAAAIAGLPVDQEGASPR